jgi:HEAT repeat protein
MRQTGADTMDMKKMIADYMENGCLDNIVDMFRHEKDLYEYIGYLMTDERLRVRIGTTALIEILRKEDPGNILKAVHSILPLLGDQNPVIRGDAAYLLGIIGDQDTIPYLEERKNDEDANVRVIAEEAIEDIKSQVQSP